MTLLHGRGPLAVMALVACGLAAAGFVALSSSGGDDPGLTACGGRSAEEYACFVRRYRELTKVAGIDGAFRALKSEHKDKPFVRSVCHTLAHEIGRTAAVHYGEVADTYARGDTFCGSGYYHGAMETIVAKIGARRAIEDARDLCTDLDGEGPRSAFHRNCVHGLGHGFMAVQRNDIFDSLPACDRLSDRWEKRNCYDGVFMQNIMSRKDRHYPSKHLRRDEPMYPCTVVKPRYKDRCYERQTVHALLSQKGSFARVFRLCAGVKADFRPACHRGLGRDAAGYALDNREGEAEQSAVTGALCGLARDAGGREDCVVGAAAFLVRQSDTDFQARALCRALEPGLRAVCNSTVRRQGDGARL